MELQVLRPLVCDHSQAVLVRGTAREGLDPRTLAPLVCDYSLMALVRAKPWEGRGLRAVWLLFSPLVRAVTKKRQLARPCQRLSWKDLTATYALLMAVQTAKRALLLPWEADLTAWPGFSAEAVVFPAGSPAGFLADAWVDFPPDSPDCGALSDLYFLLYLS